MVHRTKRRCTPIGNGVAAQEAPDMINELDQIVLTEDVPGTRLLKGDVGTVVMRHRDGAAYEVEFMTGDGETIAVVTLEPTQLRSISQTEIFHVREVA